MRVSAQGSEKRIDRPDPSGLARFLARIRWAWARHAIVRGRVFDRAWYIITYPDVARQGWDPATHYLAIGAARGLKPHLLFDPAWYQAKRPAAGNPLLDYIRNGADLDPSPYFHTAYYLAAIGRPLRRRLWTLGRRLSPLGDFVATPPGERVVPTPLFDRAWYVESYPDVTQSGFDPFLHYVASGDRDGRWPGPWFDPLWYRMRNPDARGPEGAPLAHYLGEGAMQGCDPSGAFSTQWYLTQSSESPGAGAQALLHYAWHGRHEWHSSHPTLPPPGSLVAAWGDLPWSAPFGTRPESARRVLAIVADLSAWTSCDGRTVVARLSAQTDLDVFVLSWAVLNDLPASVISLDLSQVHASRKMVVSRVLRALKFRDLSARVVEIGRDPEASSIIGELGLSSTVCEAASATSASAVVATLPAWAPRLEVSAVVPSYNHAQYLDERIGSILRQRILPSEIIALDDASTDDSVAVLERWQRRSPVPFTLVRGERNTGSTFAQWVKGVTLARSPLVWIAESDDTSSPHFLERLLPYFADDRLALAYTESRVIGEQGQWLADSYRFYTASITSRKWLTAYVEDGETEIDQALAIKNTIANASAVVFRRAVLVRHLQTIERFRYCGDWWTYVQCLQEGRIAYHPEALNCHRRSASSVTHVGVGSPMPLAEALRVQSVLWRSPGLSDRSRVLGFVQTAFEAALRGNRDLDGPFAAAIVEAWKAAVASHRRPIDGKAFLAGREFAERLACEEVGMKMPGPDTVLTYCKGLLARVATSPPVA
jgi:GT2 family glycosyltransferase